ncbi:MAG: NAD-dependent epimerase/dehydratase family protein [Candidatus Hinthialibacter antarcticus]|nr:NAD-dependent epimerase/dehydratase family protein [Candidatus Hinthialibacter antarcticus]
MKVLLTGVTGYLGEAIAREGASRGYDLRGLCRVMPPPEQRIANVEYVVGDLLEPDSLRAACAGCDALIHSAGLVSIWRRDPGDFYRVNVDATRELFQIAYEQGVERALYTSSFFALGPTDAALADETWLNDRVEPPTHYARSKTAADRLARSLMDEGRDLTTVYPGVIYGPGRRTQGNHVSTLVEDFCKRKIPGVIGPDDRRWTFSYIDDVAQGHWLALETGKAGGRYILGGQDATQAELYEMLAELTGQSAPQRRIPAALAYLVALLEEGKARFLGAAPRLTRESLRAYSYHWRFTSHKAVTELGYTRTPLKIGLQKTLDALGYAPPEDRSTLL